MLIRLPQILLLAVVSTAIVAPATAFAANRCNTKFTFKNGFSVPITVKDRIAIRGNRGDYIESLDKWRTINPGARATTRKNRLQKLDNRQRGRFSVGVKVRGNINKTISYASNTGNANYPGLENILVEMGVVKRNVRCVDNGFIEFNIKPLPNTAANLQRLRTILHDWDFNNPAVRANVNRLYFGIP